MDSLEDYARALERQRQARVIAEQLLEDKSRELFLKNQSLESALEKLVDQQQKLIAQEKLASIGRLAGGLAHDINNPNAFIISNLVVLAGYMNTLKSAMSETRQILTTVNQTQSADQLKSAIASLLDHHEIEFIADDGLNIVSELEQGAQRISKVVKGMEFFAHTDGEKTQVFDVSACLQKTIELIQHEIGSDCQIELDCPQLPQLTGVPSLISLAIANLVRNGVEAKPASHCVKVVAGVVNSDIVIDVSDDGISIPDNEINHVFDPFFSGKASTGNYGLAVSQSVMKQHNGYVELIVEDSVKIFRSHLPLDSE